MLRSLVDEGFSGKEWRTLLRQLGQILATKKWSEGIELLERMMDWNVVLNLLKKTDHHFYLGLRGKMVGFICPSTARKIEIKRSDFKILRSMKSAEKERLEVRVFEIEES